MTVRCWPVASSGSPVNWDIIIPLPDLSLFFSNCQGENGEACAIFAGPFTVTHHKSTLLIAGMFSFMNAGSGSNQSNHMYKLGPIHQGTMERGAKTTSDSYILWPARVGAFSLVMGRHVNHADTSNLPFSYLIEQRNTTYLVPGVTWEVWVLSVTHRNGRSVISEKIRTGWIISIITCWVLIPFRRCLKDVPFWKNWTCIRWNFRDLLLTRVLKSRTLL